MKQKREPEFWHELVRVGTANSVAGDTEIMRKCFLKAIMKYFKVQTA